ncbi:MAG TPA: TetR/AcrR family transcriptional regulator [Solirubrobacterales bacterium]|nr:TetR/AcrR family transcriptional regulator [Solirubrobacterales bacterium]
MSGTRWGQGKDGDPGLFGKLPPGPHRLPRELVRENQRRRILLAALEVFAERGFAAATVQDLLRVAHVSRATFYEIFPDKETCLAVLHEEVLVWLRQQVATEVSGTVGWSAKVQVAVEMTVRLLAEDPRLAVLCAIEAPTGIPRVRTRHDRVVEELSAALRAGRGESDRRNLPEMLETALICGAVYMIGRSIVYEQGPSPEVLEAELPQLMLLPYLG